MENSSYPTDASGEINKKLKTQEKYENINEISDQQHDLSNEGRILNKDIQDRTELDIELDAKRPQIVSFSDRAKPPND